VSGSSLASFAVRAVPEPSLSALALVGVLALLLAARTAGEFV